MNNSVNGLTAEEVIAKLREPLPVKDGEFEPSLTAYLERLDELFGQEWSQDVQATAQGVRCEITLVHDGFTLMKKSAIERSTIKATIMCCHFLGMGRSQISIP